MATRAPTGLEPGASGVRRPLMTVGHLAKVSPDPSAHCQIRKIPFPTHDGALGPKCVEINGTDDRHLLRWVYPPQSTHQQNKTLVSGRRSQKSGVDVLEKWV